MARLTTRLLERQDELERLAAAWRAAHAGRGSAWFIQAEAGGGKTRLMREFVAATAARVLWGAAEPVSPPEPYLAVRQALPTFAPAPTRAASVTGALDLFAEAAGAGPLLVVLDDLHFADEGTVAVVVRLVAACQTRPWLLLAAFRPEEGPGALHVAATELVAQGTANRLALPPLSHEAAANLIAAIRGAAAEPAEVATIHADGGGNP